MPAGAAAKLLYLVAFHKFHQRGGKGAVLLVGVVVRLEIKDIPVPQIADNEVLVKVMAAGVNPLDNMITKGEVKLIVPYKMPLVMGNELSGIVEKTGKNVTRFAVGDKVYGRLAPDMIKGIVAEYK